jgi:hypothetical protein
MSDPRRMRRMVDEGATPFERDLLESWSSEQPSPAAKARALAIAGAAAGTLVAATAATTAASTSGAGTAAGLAAPKAAGLGLTLAVKWGLLFVAVAATAVGGAVVAGVGGRTHADERTAATTTAPLVNTAATAITPASPASPATPPAVVADDSAKTVSPADLPPAAPPPATAAAGLGSAPRSRGAANAGAPADSSFSEEIASFDRARAALDSGDPDRTLALVDAYEKRFPAGTFVQEAEVLRVQALARKGDTAGARRVGQRFLAAHPTSPHASRIRAILDASNP